MKTISDRFAEKFGEMVFNKRRSRKLTQNQLSKAIGISRVQIANIELGDSGTQLRTALKIVREIDLEWGDIQGLWLESVEEVRFK